MKIKLGVVDDHQLFLSGLNVMLESYGFKVVVTARNGWLLQGNLENEKNLPDVMLVDTDMPVISGLETTIWLQQQYPSIKLIAMAIDEKDRAIIQMLKEGCCSYLFKTAYPDEVAKAVNEVYTKGYFNPDKVEPLSRWLFARANKQDDVALSNEEKQFLHLACTEISYEQILEEMNLSEKIAKRYINSLFAKFGVRSRLGLVLEALRSGVALAKG